MVSRVGQGEGAGKGGGKANFAAVALVRADLEYSTCWMWRERSEESFAAVGDYARGVMLRISKALVADIGKSNTSHL